MSSSPTDDLARDPAREIRTIRECHQYVRELDARFGGDIPPGPEAWDAIVAKIRAAEADMDAALDRLGEQLAEQADALRVTCVARDSTGKPMKSVHLLGDPEAVRAVVEMRTAGEAAEARVTELEGWLHRADEQSRLIAESAGEDGTSPEDWNALTAKWDVALRAVRELRKESDEDGERISKLEDALRDFAEHGTRFDCNPTVRVYNTNEWRASHEWWQNRAAQMDVAVRNRARAVLAAAKGQPE